MHDFLEKVPISRNYNIRRQYSHRHGFIFSRNSNENFENFTKSNDTILLTSQIQSRRSKVDGLWKWTVFWVIILACSWIERNQNIWGQNKICARKQIRNKNIEFNHGQNNRLMMVKLTKISERWLAQVID